MRKVFLITLPVFFVLAIAGFFYQYLITYNEILSMLASFSGQCFVFLALGRMFYNGSFKNTVWSRISYFGFAILIAGMLFKLQHWPGQYVFILTGCSIIGIAYVIHFIKKRVKVLLDWEKVLYVITLMVAITFRMLHYGFNEVLSWLLLIIGISLIATFYFYELKRIEKVSVVELDNEGENVFKYED